MLWFVLQSLSMLLVAGGSGLLVGWLLWGRQWVRLEQAPAGTEAVDSLPGSQLEDDDTRVPEPAALVTASPADGSTDVAAGTGNVPLDRLGLGPLGSGGTGWPVEAAGPAEPVEAAAPAEPVETDAPAPVSAEPEPAEDEDLPALTAPEPGPLSGRLGQAELLDDLTRIEGITPVMARALAAEGLGSFFSVSNAGEDELRRALRVNRIRSAPGIAFWSARAGELAQEETAAHAVGTPAPAAEQLIDITDATLAAARSDPGEADAPADLEWLAAHREAVRAAPAEAPAEQAQSVPDAEPAPLAEPAPVLDADPVARSSVGATTDTVPAQGAPAAPMVGLPIVAPSDPTPTPSSVVIKPSTGDDLERIEGVGPKIAEVLRGAGLTTYAALAAAHDHELEALLKKAGLRFAPTLSTWSVQAALLLQGDVAGADTLARGLMVGRKTS